MQQPVLSVVFFCCVTQAYFPIMDKKKKKRFYPNMVHYILCVIKTELYKHTGLWVVVCAWTELPMK